MSSVPSAAPSRTRVLVIDDNEGIHATLRSLLRSRSGMTPARRSGVERELFGGSPGADKPFDIHGLRQTVRRLLTQF